MTNSTAIATPATVAPVVAPKAPPAKRELSNAGRAAVKRLSDARAAIKAAKVIEDEAKAAIFAELDGSKAGTVGGMTVVKVQPGTNSGFDRETLKNAFPEAYDAAYRESTYESLRTF